MAAEYPPFMNAYGNIPKMLKKMQTAQTPVRFTQDFLGTVLGFSGGSSRPFIPLAKRIGLLASDGSPTELYKRFRNPPQAGAAMAEAIRRGYGDLYKRNEFVHKMDKKGLEGLVKEATGLEANAPTLRAIVNTFDALKQFADFDAVGAKSEEPSEEEMQEHDEGEEAPPAALRFSYTIYLNLPNTSDIAVFNAIFKSLRENLLK
jgi:hypothetical protein